MRTPGGLLTKRTQPGRAGKSRDYWRGIFLMAAMKPRTGDGPMEVTKEGRSLIMRVPLEGGGRLVVELNTAEATNLRECLVGVTE
ncbi:hypothetical protein ASG71_07095 [Arthrobacter sp. Soil763]|nr:hypothetical protein ASG71_07095 [Arthrobacter sp. Soil763]